MNNDSWCWQDRIFEPTKALLPRAILSFPVPQSQSHAHSTRKLVDQAHKDGLQKSTPRQYEKNLQKHEINKTSVISSIQSAMKKRKGRMQQQFEIEKTQHTKNITVTQKNVPDVIRDKVLEKIFEKRSAIRKRACDNLHLIYGLMQSKTTTFEDLLR